MLYESIHNVEIISHNRCILTVFHQCVLKYALRNVSGGQLHYISANIIIYSIVNVMFLLEKRFNRTHYIKNV